MALGQVIVDNLNLGQGAVTEVERYFLFIGPAAKNVGQFIPLNTDSDLDAALGVPASDLKTQIAAARQNGGQRWACIAAPIGAEGDWATALEKTQQQGVSVEAVIITKPVVKADELSAMHDAAVTLNNTYGRRVFFLASSVGIAVDQTWAQYLAEQKALVANLAAPRVAVVPQLHGNDLGVLAGRLANAAVSIADSPMRVATGAVLGLGEVPVDSELTRCRPPCVANWTARGCRLRKPTRITQACTGVTATCWTLPAVTFRSWNTCASPIRPLA